MTNTTPKDNKITKQTLIGEALKICPESAEIMFDYGLHCIGCCGATMESIEDGAKAHGLSDKEIQEMMDKINKKVKK